MVSGLGQADTIIMAPSTMPQSIATVSQLRQSCMERSSATSSLEM
jgi:hypothetical protein